MNPSAEITAFVIARTNPQIEDVADGIGIEESTARQLIGKLGAQGILRREGEYVFVKDPLLAKSMANGATQDYAVKVPKWNPPASASGAALARAAGGPAMPYADEELSTMRAVLETLRALWDRENPELIPAAGSSLSADSKPA